MDTHIHFGGVFAQNTPFVQFHYNLQIFDRMGVNL